MEYTGPSSLYNNNAIDDSNIKSLIKSYRQGEIEFGRVVEYLAPLIYSFPKLSYSLNEDACGSFFEYVLVRIKDILSKYSITEVKFITWFAIVIRRTFYNWYQTRYEKPKEITTLNNKVSNGIDKEFIEFLSDDDEDDNEVYIEVLESIEQLPPNIEIVIKLHFFNFFSETDIPKASKIFNREISTLLYLYNKYKINSIERSEKTQDLKRRMGKNYEKYISAKDEEKKAVKDSSKNALKYKDKYIKNLNELKKKFPTVKNSEIAHILGIDARQVANYIFKGKEMLRERLEKYKKK